MEVKGKIYSFIFISIVTLGVAPAVNIEQAIRSKKALPETLEGWKQLSYNMDFAIPGLGMILYKLGISASPDKVIIGKDGWMFLGDSFESTVTAKRTGITSAGIAKANIINDFSKEWRSWFSSNGVRSYYVLIGPDKSTIYPENLPDWAAPSDNSIAKYLHDKSPDIFVYPKNEIIDMKSRSSAPLYYKTDTHWNTLGAWVSFNSMMECIESDIPNISIPKAPKPESVNIRKRGGGDLSAFQRIRPYITDTEVDLSDNSIRKMQVSQVDFQSMKPVYSGDNIQVTAPVKPLLVQSKGALNNNRVLWLRDSFGSAISPLMAATFSETLQLHHQSSSPKIIADLVEKYKPDIVIVTIVERNTRIGILVSPPPKLSGK
ncbi:hypothetical protein IPC19_05560 [Pseudomonas aeruginosa]|nr:hypothetical protein AO969_33415 [Pseudomonas aeruginosa]OVZ40950.1 hypothetical protein CDO41_22985 [Pseudomonas aeruginosa]RQI53452.1 hypothetical protein IPC19_05560 [Pseudomonas aeruginosa]